MCTAPRAAYWKKAKSVHRDVIDVARSARDVLGGIDAGERLEVVDEVRLVEVAARERHIGPIDVRLLIHEMQHALKSPHAAEDLRRESDLFEEELLESAGADADCVDDRRDASDSAELTERESHGSVLI